MIAVGVVLAVLLIVLAARRAARRRVNVKVEVVGRREVGARTIGFGDTPGRHGRIRANKRWGL